jgi:hypothetical protein
MISVFVFVKIENNLIYLQDKKQDKLSEYCVCIALMYIC